MTTINSAVRTFSRLATSIHADFAHAQDMDHAICPDGYGAVHLQDEYDERLQELAVRVATRYRITLLQLAVAVNNRFESAVL